MNVIVKPAVFLTQKAVWVGSRVMVKEGTVERSDGAVNVVVERVSGAKEKTGEISAT